MRSERAQRLLALFASEIDEHLVSLSDNLLAVERAGAAAPERVDEIFRSYHTLKGSSRAVGATGLEAVCHRFEDLLAKVRAGERSLDPELVELALRSLDTIRAVREAGIDISSSDPLVSGFLDQLDAVLSDNDEPEAPPARPVEETLFEPPPPPPEERLPEPPAPEAKRSRGAETIRVGAGKLDTLMNRVGELLISRIKTVQRVSDMDAMATASGRVASALAALRRKAAAGAADDAAWQVAEDAVHDMDQRALALQRNLSADIGRMALVSRELEEDVRALRLVPFSDGLGMLPRLVRDTARALDKDVVLRIEGGDTEVDKGILEGLKDPIIHLINNAIDHGLESAVERLGAGKEQEGTITLRARQRGMRFIVEVSDDGRGVDVEAVREKAAQLGLVPRDEAAALTREECVELLFRPGFSTASEVTPYSGRGVGMDVVREQLTRLHGTCELTTQWGQGTMVTLSLPLTLITTQALLVRCRNELLAIPTSAVERTLEVPAAELVKVDTQDAIRVGGLPIAAVRLADVLELPPRAASGEAVHRVVVLADAARRVAILVDDIEGEQEVVHKALGRQFVRVRNVSGATILGTGRVVIILNPQELIVHALEQRPRAAGRPHAAPRRRCVLLVEDNSWTRASQRELLESAGFDVVTAVDGVNALEVMRQRAVDLVVADVEMPRMDGITFTRQLRAQPLFRRLPVVMVSALDSQEQVYEGLQAGANAYVCKSQFERSGFLDLLNNLVGGAA